MNKKEKSIREVSKYDVVIITGASSGIGEGFAKFALEAFEVSKKDAKIFNVSRSLAKFDNKNFTNIECDLMNAQSRHLAISRIKTDIALLGVENPKILLINNSGFGAYGMFPAPTLERNLDMIDLNVKALTAMCGAFLSDIERSKGAIINIASTASFQAFPHLSVYAATKAYVKSFTMSLAQELKDKGCKCLCVCPGPTSSMFFKSAGFDSAPLPSGFGHKPIDVVLKSFSSLYDNKIMAIVGVINTFQAIIVSFIPECVLVKVSDFILKKIRSK